MERNKSEVFSESDSDLPKSKTWNYIIIGTGMGGGPIGLRLAQAGVSVLFIEKGSSLKRPDSIRGEFPEMKEGDPKQLLQKGGRYPDAICDVTSFWHRALTPFLGQGVGGSSALYGMVLDRFHSRDFKTWPLSYEELLKYYEEAEALFKVRKRLPYRHPGNRKIEEFLNGRGLVPYPLRLANDDHPSCGSCQSIICAFKCKNDSGKICIEPAVDHHGASLLTECEVERIESSGSQVTGVTVRHQGEQKFIAAQNVVLAAGAIQSPLLLMKSATEAFPSGLGNQSGYVGRNLMRHFVDLYALEVDSEPENKHCKEIGVNIFDQQLGMRLGTVQSFGRLPPVEVILTQLERDIPFSFLKLLFRLFRPVLRIILRGQMSGMLVMASITEDSPRFENRVWTENGKILIHYRISSEDRKKIRVLRQKLKALFKPLGLWFIASSEKNEMLAHVCGTCRMGEDPMKSVVDRENKVHGLSNLYVVDGSFFPTSAETNPALTIAANSLRVADLLIRRKKIKD